MDLLVLFMIGAGWMAWKSKRPLKLVLSHEEAEDVKARWWSSARHELKVWCFVFFATCVLLASFGCPRSWYPALGLAELMLVSRLVLWTALASLFVAWVVLCVSVLIGHQLFGAQYVMAPVVWCVFVIVIRFFGFVYFHSRSALVRI